MIHPVDPVKILLFSLRPLRLCGEIFFFVFSSPLDRVRMAWFKEANQIPPTPFVEGGVTIPHS